MSLFIGIDSGTQSVKAVVLDLEARKVIAEARAPHALIAGLPVGHMEQHPQEWVAAMDQVIAEVVAKIDRSRVRGIGVSGQQHGFVPLDAQGGVIRPAKLWCDTSTAAECALITKKLGGEKAAIRKTGNLILPGFTAPKILWLKRREPANYKRLRHVLLPHDYLNFHLTGNYFMEYGDASGSALMDVRRRVWSTEAISAIDKNLADWLPELSDSNTAAGTLRPELAAKYGLSTDVVVSAGGGDNMMGAIGTGNIQPGAITMSLGSSGTVYAYADSPTVSADAAVATFCSSSGGWLPLICTMNLTNATGVIRDLFDLDIECFNALVAQAPIGADGVCMLPFLNGERVPALPHATGSVLGLNMTNLTQANLCRAVVEGTTFGLRYGLDLLRHNGLQSRSICLIGGGSNSQVWRQIVADTMNTPVICTEQSEAAALGAAIQAAWCTSWANGHEDSLEDLCERCVKLDLASETLPIADNVAASQQAYERYRQHVATL